MNKRQERQNKIIAFIEEKKEVSASDILSFLSVNIDRKTLQRDLKDLEERFLILKGGSGRSTVYSLVSYYEILKEINVEKYFSTPYIDREIKESFDFEVFEILEDGVFTVEEKNRIENLQDEFINNFSKYDSQTLVNKEFERIMIEFSWKSSAIEGNTYSLLNTEALLKENIAGKGKTERETQMILNHKDAFNESIQNKERFKKLNYSDIEYIHRVLTKGLDIQKNIRTGPIGGITGTKYKPLSNETTSKAHINKFFPVYFQYFMY